MTAAARRVYERVMRTLRIHVATALAVLVLALPAVLAAELNSRVIRRSSAAVMAGDRALKQGDLDRASEQFEEALRLVPDQPDAQMGLGHVAFRRQQYEAALDWFTRARDGLIELNRRAWDREQQAYEDAVRLIPRLEDDIIGLRSIPSANVTQQVRDIERRIESLRLVRPPSKSHPEDPPGSVYFHRGTALFRLGRYDEAIEDWKTCARLDPKFGPVHNNLAVAHWQLGHIAEARAELAEAKRLGVAVNPDFEAQLSATAGS